MDIGKGQPHQKRCKRWDIPSSAHYLTFSCFKRQPFFQSELACRWFLDTLNTARTKQPFDLWAYVIMPEHVHIVLLPGVETKISAILKTIKLSLARKFLIWVRRENSSFLAQMKDRQPNGKVAYRFWQRGGGHDRNLRSNHDVHEKIRYIHANPVRRGLVAQPEDWLWSSYKAHFNSVDEPIPIDRDNIPFVGT